MQGFGRLARSRPACYDAARVRILLDYRPALRQRTGVGEYVHELAAALLPRLRPSRVADAVLELVEGPPGPPTPCRAPASSMPACPGPRAEPGLASAGVAAGRAVRRSRRRRPLDAPAAAAEPACAPSASSPSTTSISSIIPSRTRAEIRRDYPALAARPCAARRPGRGDFGAHRAARCGAASASRPSGSCCAGPVRRLPRSAATAIGRDRSCSSARSSRGRTCRRCFAAYEQLLARAPGAPPLVLAGGAVEHSEEILGGLRARSRRLPAGSSYRGYVSDAERQALYASASMLVLPSFHEGFGLPAVEAMHGRRAGDRLDGRRLAGGGRDGGHHGRSG